MSCALCVVTVGGGLLIARKLGINDMVFAIWLSGFNTAIAFWLSSVIKHKFFGNTFFLTLLFYLSTYVYLLKTGQMSGDVLVGLTIGTVSLLVAYVIEKRRRFIPFQKVIFPLAFLILSTLLAAAYQAF